MCGICGIVARDRDYQVDVQTLLGMRDSLISRGPDDAGHYTGKGVGLGTRRLAILDLSERAHMPMSAQNGRYWITYNGEVYNYRELREDLKSRGYQFNSNSDTEVVLNAYIEYGPAALDMFNGMFAFAIWDERERKLFLGRDRLGIKPLYYAAHDGKLYFASEEKAIFAAGVACEFDWDSLEELLCFRYVAGEQTPFKGIKRLLPGHYLFWKDGEIQIKRWWHLAERAQALRGTLPNDPTEWFKSAFDDSIKLRNISDVPVGVLLSGGLDSSSVAASLASQVEHRVASFTVRFAEPDYDEGPLAKEIAKKWNLDYHELTLEPSKLLDLLHEASWMNDEPLVHGNDVHLHAISRYAKSRVTVLLSGEGGDETLGGYVRYQPLRYPRLLRAARPVLPRFTSTLGLNGRLSKLSKFLTLDSINQFVLFNACEVLPFELRRLGFEPQARFEFREQVLAEAALLYPNEPVRQAMYSDQLTFLCSILDRNDRMTMGASIECRVPFLDCRLVEGAAAFPSSVLFDGRAPKNLLRKAVGDRLPYATLSHRKWGFGVPWAKYFRSVSQLREVIQNLHNTKPFVDGPFERSAILRMTDGFLNGHDHEDDLLILRLVMISIWHRVFFDTNSRASSGRINENLGTSGLNALQKQGSVATVPN